MYDALQQLWQAILDVTAQFVIPDWGATVGLLPILLVLGVIGPIVSLIALGWFVFWVRKPRTKVVYDDGPWPARLSSGGELDYPAGEPYCSRDRLVYAPGETRCVGCGDDLLVTCPKCSTTRAAAQDTCGRCGLVLRIEPRVRTLMPAGPRPGGRAIA